MLRENTDYASILENRYDNALPEARALYDRYKEHIKVSDVDTQTGARYSSGAGDVTVNITEDARSNPESGWVYYHEVGHLIDDQMKDGQGNGSISDSEAFGNALRNDFDNYVTNYMAENGITNREDAYTAIGQMMKSDADRYKGVSDVYGGLSQNQVSGGWGHSNDYWSGSTNAVNHEAFAHMFEASMGGDPKALEYIKEMLPTAYEEFLRLIEAA